MSIPTLQLNQKPTLDLRPRLMMSTHMQQALRLLQLPLDELDVFLEEQVVLNPVLEFYDEERNLDEGLQSYQENPEKELTIGERDLSILKELGEDFQNAFEQENHPIKLSSQEDKLKTFLEESIKANLSLQEHLKGLIREQFDDLKDLNAAEYLIGYIDECGFLTNSLDEISLLHGIERSRLQVILKCIQSLEPYGMGAATLQESLLIQLKCLSKQNSLAYAIIDHHYDDLLHSRLPMIQKKLHRNLQEIQKAIEEDIAKLDLHPGAQFSPSVASIIIPDACIYQDGDQLKVELNREHLHQLHFNYRYLKMLESPDIPIETKNFIRQHILSAKWLMRNLQQRYSTVERISHVLIEKQRDFFLKPDGLLVPLTMKIVADELQVHESTVARTVANKSIHTPRGLFPLRFFFTTSYQLEDSVLSSNTIQERIAELIRHEDKKHPLSDAAISNILKKEGIPCARRTVAKYRDILHIGNALQRKKY